MLIGAEIFYKLMCPGQLRQNSIPPLLFQKTVLGWVASGKINHFNAEGSTAASATVHVEDRLEQTLQSFWELEEVNPAQRFLGIESRCEEAYTTHTTRSPDGRYTVPLLVDNEKLSRIGDTRGMAQTRFYATERRLQGNPRLRKDYNQFMQEYINLGHMKEDTAEVQCHELEVFLPHHCVIKADSETTRLRVVFDGSARGTKGMSLNNALLVGPTVQDDLFSITARFRTHRYVFTGDIEKMYRQIKIMKSQTHLQKIFWRDSPHQPLKTFTLQTVTYGTSSASYLATRTLAQLAQDDGVMFPLAAGIINKDFYVDDVLTGADTLTEALELRNQLIQLCNGGKFKLRKWCANHPDLLNNLSPEDLGEIHKFTHEGSNGLTKTLGTYWQPRDDELHYTMRSFSSTNAWTKRNMVSEMARLFDPLGLIGPVVVRAKILVRELWREKLNWDTQLPDSHQRNWASYYNQLADVNKIRIPRRVIQVTEPIDLQLHIFCDASEAAYGACAYIRSRNRYDVTSCELLCSRSRVAPLKGTTIPRLELCAALLASRLATKITTALPLKFSKHVIWSDSTIALAWIKNHQGSNQWKQFVANRVAEIQERTIGYYWYHVGTNDNPADHISRGLSPGKLSNCDSWWHGPSWLQANEQQWPNAVVAMSDAEIPERRLPIAVSLKILTQTEPHLEMMYSQLEKLQRIISYCLRFRHNCRATGESMQGPITTVELHGALNVLIKRAQERHFQEEMNDLVRDQHLRTNSKLKSLNPFMDASGILRVGGRLQFANVSYDERHPIILIANDPLTRLIIDYEHRRLMHAGPQHLLASLRRHYWILGGRSAVRLHTHKCMKCYRWKIKAATQLMGSLPAARVNPSPAFYVTGLDYAGPIVIRHGGARSRVLTKAYVALFVCFSTRAIHLELVSDLTSVAFLAALRRFISRRGKPMQIHSDNGTNFVGANRLLGKFLNNESLRKGILEQSHQEGIEWRFIPPHAPHFGGLWEAGVKSTKYHLRRCIGDTILRFEELYTVLTQIEAVLNSRPVMAVSDDPENLEALTPGHFLIGRPLTTFSEPTLHDEPAINCPRRRWDLVQRMCQQFWLRWRHDYLNSLQQRPKWSRSEANFKTGDLVILKEDHQPPLEWNLGRITQLHQGSDGLVRVVSLKTRNGTLKRPITKLAMLPIQHEPHS